MTSHGSKKPKSNVRQLKALAAARLYPAEYAALQQAATADGKSVSEYLRTLVLRDLTPA